MVTAFLLTLFAGLSTGIGSALAFFTKRTNTKFLSLSLGFSAGVMIYISFVEMLGESFSTLGEIMGERYGSIITVISFFVGILIALIIDRLVPNYENPHEPRMIEEMEGKCCGRMLHRRRKLMRMGFLTAVVVAIHNLPEGVVTFMSTMQDTSMGVAVAIAIAIHNIPEGIAVSVPIYYATGSKKKAFFYSFLSGLAEPLGAVIACLFLYKFYNDSAVAIISAGVAGIMVFISLDELLPAAREYGEHHLSIYGLVFGMLVMAVSLIII